jgi:ribosomal protein S18 acetylase RimI-like enzyme
MAALATAAITLRPAGPDDDTLLRRVYASVRADELAQVQWSDEVKDVFLRHQFDAQHAHYRENYVGASFDVIEVDGEPVGRLYVARWSDEIRIMDIALLPEHRGAGVGTALLRELLDEGAQSGKRVSIHVEMNNPALRLYERLGFAPVDQTGVYLRLEATP